MEYVGKTVRRSVVGLREAREYDARCGAGTYVFGMSASSGPCTDATSVRILPHVKKAGTHKILKSTLGCNAETPGLGMSASSSLCTNATSVE